MAKEKVLFKHETLELSEQPCIVHFSNPPPATAFDSSTEDENRLHFTRVTNKDSKRVKYVSAETEKIEYKGNVDAAEASRFLVGVFNKKDNTISLIQTTGIFHLHQKVKGFNDDTNEAEDVDKGFYEKRTDLTKAFGSNRALRIARKTAANAVKTTAAEVFDIAKEALDSASVVPKDSELDVLPSHNTTTDVVSEVFNVNDCVISKCLRECDITPFTTMLGSTKAFGELESNYERHITAYLKKLLVSVKNQKNKKSEKEDSEEEIEEGKNTKKRKAGKDEEKTPKLEVTEQDLKYLMYLHYLLQFIAGARTLPNLVRNAFKRRYETASGASLCLNEAIVMCLYFSDYKIDLEALSHDTKKEPATLALHLKSVGCKLIDDNLYKLIAPFTPLKSGKRSMFRQK